MDTCFYVSPIGRILIASDDIGLAGLWFEGSKYFPAELSASDYKMTPALRGAVRWLDEYFSGREPDFTPPLHLSGSDFRMRVWSELMKIPYGQTVTYGDIARAVGCKSAQAVGGAVGHNPVSLIVPCHRVLGADGTLTGYAAGTERKQYLLRLECK